MPETVQFNPIQPTTTHIVLDLLMVSANNAPTTVGSMEILVFLLIQCVAEQTQPMETVLVVILDTYYKEVDVF
jgi:hypothetical protein